MLHLLRKITPKPLLQSYHFCLAKLAAFWYGYPSRELVVIGVTGTNGKTTTTYLIAKALEASGYQTGCTTTALFKVGEKEWINPLKMTMPGRFFLQRTLRNMVKAGCKYAVIETSSQGLIQFRHIGIEYDIAVFTNLTPEHIEAHGGFENYKKAKGILFEHVAARPEKVIEGKLIPKAVVLNADDEHADFYASKSGSAAIQLYGIETDKGLMGKDLQLEAGTSQFTVEGLKACIQLPGRYNVLNVLAALATSKVLGVNLERAIERLSMVRHVPGRFQRVELGQPYQVVVDYAPEPESLKQLYQAVQLLKPKRLIHVLGSCGGGRDVARRPILGEMAAKQADFVIITNEDPYDDDPMMIMKQVAAGARHAGKVEDFNLWLILDRAEAIQRAVGMAEPGDVVLLTGKGCETWICWERGRKQPWDEAKIAEEAIKARMAKSG